MFPSLEGEQHSAAQPTVASVQKLDGVKKIGGS
jgi:hypothetical protein